MQTSLLSWDEELFYKLREKKQKDLENLFSKGVLNPFVIHLSNPFSFLFTFALFCVSASVFEKSKTEGIYLVPFVNKVGLFDICLILSKEDYDSFDVERFLEPSLKKKVLFIRIGSKENVQDKGYKCIFPNHVLEDVKTKTSKENEASPLLEHVGDLILPYLEETYLDKMHTPSYIESFMLLHCPNLKFKTPSVSVLLVFDRAFLGMKSFYSVFNEHTVTFNRNSDSSLQDQGLEYLEKTANFQKSLRIKNPSPVLAFFKTTTRKADTITCKYFPSENDCPYDRTDDGLKSKELSEILFYKPHTAFNEGSF